MIVSREGLGQHAVLRNRSVAHAAKSCVNVLVVWLEPVAKRAAQHAGGGPRRSAFHHVVFAVEKVRGVAGIEGKPFEAGKRLEPARRPLPSIAQQISDTESALAFRECTNRGRVPTREVKIALARIWSSSAPRKGPLRSSFRSISRPMPLRFR